MAGHVAVLDTNVQLEVHSCHDLDEVATALTNSLVDVPIGHPKLEYRRRRVRDSLLMVAHFDRIGASTYCLHFEAVEMLLRRAPPGASATAAFTTQFLYFVKDYVLPNWQSLMPKEAETVKGRAADDELIDRALEFGVPLITNEGNTETGSDHSDPKKIPYKAMVRGVKVYSPREYIAGKFDPEVEATRFLDRFAREAPGYIRGHCEKFGPDGIADALNWINKYYRWIFINDIRF
jgi:hypothetical protein